MSTNTNHQDPIVAAELEEGQTLIQINSRYSFGDFVSLSFVEHTVVKVLKTVVVLERASDGKETRVQIENSKYSSFRNGQLTAEIYGSDKSTYRRPTIELATIDDPKIAELQAKFDANQAKKAQERVTRDAVEALKVNDLATVEAAIQALQAQADYLRAQQA